MTKITELYNQLEKVQEYPQYQELQIEVLKLQKQIKVLQSTIMLEQKKNWIENWERIVSDINRKYDKQKSQISNNRGV